MKKHPYPFILSCILLVLPLISWAQNNYDMNFVVTQNDNTNNGTLKVKLQIRASTTSFDMGNSNLRFFYNAGAVTYSSTAFDASNFPTFGVSALGGGFLGEHTVKDNLDNPLPGTNLLSINTRLLSTNNGPTIPTSWVDVAEITFTIVDVTASKRFRFSTPGVAAGNTIFKLEDNATNAGTGGSLWDNVTWNGSSWFGGNGTNGAPDATDGVKELIIASGTASINDEVHCDSLAIANGATLNLNTSVSNQGKLRVLSDQSAVNGSFNVHASADGYAQYIGPAAPLVVEQYVGNTDGWRHLGIPVSGALGAVVSLGGAPMHYATDPAGPNLYTFETVGFSWDPVPNASTDVGLKGFIAHVGGVHFPVANGLISFTGTSKADSLGINYSFPTQAAPTLGRENFEGWNLVANPYPCNIDFHTLNDQNGGIFSAYSVWDPQQGQNGVYQSYTELNGGMGVNGGQRYIAPGQGFWLKSAGSHGISFDFTNADRTFDGGSVFVGAFKTTTASVPVIRLQAATSTGGTDETVICFPQGSVAGFHQQSGDVFKPWNAGGTNLFSYPKGSGEQLAINAYGHFDPTAVIPVGFNGDTTVGVSHTISLNTDELDAAWGKVYLEDLRLNRVHELNSGPYTFAPSPLADIHRFNVRFTNTTVGMDNPVRIASDIYAYTREDMIHLVFVNPVEAQADVRLYAMSGQLVHEGLQVATAAPYTIPAHGLARGLYALKVGAKGKPAQSLKVIIH